LVACRSDGEKNFDDTLIQDLTQMIDANNRLAKNFRKVRDLVEQNVTSDFCLRLLRNRSKDARMHNIPEVDEVAALIVGDTDSIEYGRDIIVRKESGHLERLHETHTSFIPLQYPLIFPYGEDGFSENIKISEKEEANPDRTRTRVAMREYVAFRIQERSVEFGNIVYSKRLFQQYSVDTYTMIESQRLSYIRANQDTIRCDILHGLQDAVTRGETNASSIGRRVILPGSFTGGMRYMFNNCQDAMAVCKRYGYPDLFITITCNSNWREIQDFVKARNLKACDRPDIVCRVFKIKLDQLMDDLRKGELFGKVDAGK